jgi:DNA-binding beta-propeller fold protein YncE
MGRQIGRISVLPLAAVVVLCSAALSGASRVENSAVGDLSPLGCIGTVGVGPAGCSTSADLASAYDVAVSPDGKDVYATGFNSDSLVVFTRRADGSLVSTGCIGNTGTGGKTCTGVSAMRGPAPVVVSPDGKNVYVGAAGTDALDVFSRAANGALTWVSCIGTTGRDTAGCGVTANLNDIDGIVVSTDGNNVYAISALSNAIEVFSRNDTGALTPAGCIGDSQSGPKNCTPADGLDGPGAIVTNGDFVYVGSRHAVTTFKRGAGGALTATDCIGNVPPVTKLCRGYAATEGVFGLAVSQDGSNVYAASSTGGAVVAFARNGSDGLDPLGCLGVRDQPNNPGFCTSAAGLVGASGVAVSPDGANVYVTAATSNDVVAFTRGASGTLTPAGCVGSLDAVAPCSGSAGLVSAHRIVVSPDGKTVYVVGQTPGALVELSRATTSTSTPTPGLTARLVFATVSENKQGLRTLTLKVTVSAAAPAQVQLLGKKSRVVMSQTVTLKNGANTVAVKLAPRIAAGSYKLRVVVTGAGGAAPTSVTAVVLVPK